MVKKLIFLCGARDFHAYDWYSEVKKIYPGQIEIFTDMIASEGFDKLVNNSDKIKNLFIIDSLLLSKQGKLSDLWRNIIKVIVLPLQVFLLRRYIKKENCNYIVHCHAMYYIVLAYLAGIDYVSTTQGSELLIRAKKSFFYKYFSSKALIGSKSILVDSKKLKDEIYNNINRDALIIQNGVDTKSCLSYTNNLTVRDIILSNRSITELYNIKDLIVSRNKSFSNFPIEFIYPQYDNVYLSACIQLSRHNDKFHGRLNKNDMYDLLFQTKIVFSIPSSDSSPRSVYEAIFCGCIVCIADNSYYYDMPNSMRCRIVIVDFSNKDWFQQAIDKAIELSQNQFLPCDRAINKFDINHSMKTVVDNIYLNF